MRINEKNGVKYLTFDLLTNTGLVNHCFSTRVGGVSLGKYQALNLGLGRGDEKERVVENYRRLSECLGFCVDNILYASQVHGIRIYPGGGPDLGRGLLNGGVTGYDGFVTDVAGLVPTIFTADCVPLFFLDPVKKVIGLSHSGWRGTVMGMAFETVAEMRGRYGCKPSDILAGIGPSICRECFEVDEPVASQFYEKLPDGSEFIHRAGEKYHVDLWGVNRYFMLEAGLLPQHIELPGICTKCNPHLFYSHRRSGMERGSMAAFMTLKGEEHK